MNGRPLGCQSSLACGTWSKKSKSVPFGPGSGRDPGGSLFRARYLKSE